MGIPMILDVLIYCCAAVVIVVGTYVIVRFLKSEAKKRKK